MIGGGGVAAKTSRPTASYFRPFLQACTLVRPEKVDGVTVPVVPVCGGICTNRPVTSVIPDAATHSVQNDVL